MRLTATIRDAIVVDILSDLPDTVGEAYKHLEKTAYDVAWGLAPAVIRMVRDAGLGHYLQLSGVRVEVPNRYRVSSAPSEVVLDAAVDQRVLDAAEEYRRVYYEREKLKTELEANLGACSTLKVFKDRFPALAKYAEKYEVAGVAEVKNLPASTSLMDALRAAGLPQEAAQ